MAGFVFAVHFAFVVSPGRRLTMKENHGGKLWGAFVKIGCGAQPDSFVGVGGDAQANDMRISFLFFCFFLFLDLRSARSTV